MKDEEPGLRRVLGGRRRRRVPGGRAHSHRVRVTPEEEGRLLARASAAGVSVPRLLVEAALRDEEPLPAARAELVTELLRMRREVRGIAANANQLARHANQTGVVLPETERTYGQANRMLRELERLTLEIAGRA